MLATWLALRNESLGTCTGKLVVRNANSSSFLTPFGGDFVDFGGICWSRGARRLVRLLRAERAWGAGGVVFTHWGKIDLCKEYFTSVFSLLQATQRSRLQSLHLYWRGGKTRSYGDEKTSGDRGQAACPGGLLMELLNFSQKKGQINKHQLFKNCGLVCVKWRVGKSQEEPTWGLAWALTVTPWKLLPWLTNCSSSPGNNDYKTRGLLTTDFSLLCWFKALLQSISLR